MTIVPVGFRAGSAVGGILHVRMGRRLYGLKGADQRLWTTAHRLPPLAAAWWYEDLLEAASLPGRPDAVMRQAGERLLAVGLLADLGEGGAPSVRAARQLCARGLQQVLGEQPDGREMVGLLDHPVALLEAIVVDALRRCSDAATVHEVAEDLHVATDGVLSVVDACTGLLGDLEPLVWRRLAYFDRPPGDGTTDVQYLFCW